MIFSFTGRQLYTPRNGKSFPRPLRMDVYSPVPILANPSVVNPFHDLHHTSDFSLPVLAIDLRLPTPAISQLAPSNAQLRRSAARPRIHPDCKASAFPAGNAPRLHNLDAGSPPSRPRHSPSAIRRRSCAVRHPSFAHPIRLPVFTVRGRNRRI